MFCPKCGTENDDSAAFCTACGGVLPNTAPAGESSRNIYEWTDDQNDHQPLSDDGQPMKWWKFLVYFGLIAAAVIDLLAGLFVMTGGHWGRYASSNYAAYKGLRVVDIVYGICLCGMGVWYILTRQSLYKFKEKGPGMLLISYAMSVVAAILPSVFYTVILSVSFWDITSGNDVLGIFCQIAMIVVNKIYFDKRASMFVN